MNYIKIYSSFCFDESQIPFGNVIFDYDWRKDAPDEKYPFEYFFEMDDKEGEESDTFENLHKAFVSDCKGVIEWLNENIGTSNYYINNMSGSTDEEIGYQ